MASITIALHVRVLKKRLATVNRSLARRFNIALLFMVWPRVQQLHVSRTVPIGAIKTPTAMPIVAPVEGLALLLVAAEVELEFRDGVAGNGASVGDGRPPAPNNTSRELEQAAAC
jgi:hypothetical protein